MTEQEIETAYNEMLEMWGDKLPNFEQEPRRFAFYVKMWKYAKSKETS